MIIPNHMEKNNPNHQPVYIYILSIQYPYIIHRLSIDYVPVTTNQICFDLIEHGLLQESHACIHHRDAGRGVGDRWGRSANGSTEGAERCGDHGRKLTPRPGVISVRSWGILKFLVTPKSDEFQIPYMKIMQSVSKCLWYCIILM